MECESSTCNIYEALDKLFAGDKQAQPAAVVEKLRESFPHSVRSIWPSVNSAAAAGWKVGPVMVRARCMIQDALGSEFYAASCEVTKGDAKRVVSGVLRDSFGDEEVTRTLEHAARHCYVAVPIPGATEWYTRHFDEQTPSATANGNMDMKRPKLEAAAERIVLERFVAKFIDDAAEELRVNTVFDVYGVLAGHGFGENPEMEGEQEDCSSPTNLAGVPNLHVVHYEPVVGAPEALLSTLPPAATLLPRLRSLMVECVGDELAADYLVMHLMSSTYARADNATICALPLNVCGVKETRGVEEIMKALAAKVKTLPLTSASMSTAPFHSIKCYKTNRLQQGELQLADGTHLIIDETVTPKGKMAVGEHASGNLGTLHKVISEQKIEYEFGFYRCPFEVDVPVMVLSEERSRYVATPFRLCLPAGPAPSADPINRLSESDLLALRLALLRAKAALKDVVVSGDVAKAIQEDFVRMCADPSTTFASDEKADKLSQMLIVTRLVCVLRGHSEMSVDSWKVAVLMEKRREEELNARFPPAPTEADFVAENKEN